jgi:hypothetical protein
MDVKMDIKVRFFRIFLRKNVSKEYRPKNVYLYPKINKNAKNTLRQKRL